MAQAGLERMNLLPENYEVLQWMLPAPAQGAIMIVCRENDKKLLENVAALNDEHTAVCTKIERDFLNTLMGGCSTPISALAEMTDDKIVFKGNILSLDGKEKMEIEKTATLTKAYELGKESANELLQTGADKIVQKIRNAAK
jgi:hydroxymethylbilane synthase